MSTIVPPLVVIVIVVFAGLLHWRQHGLGKWRGGPRLVAIGLIAVGWAAIGLVAPLSRAAGHAIGTWCADLMSAAGYPQANTLITTLGDNAPWITGLVLAYLWFRALGPGVSETMGYALAWCGVLVPGLILGGPAIIDRMGRTTFGAIASGVSHLVATIVAHRTA